MNDDMTTFRVTLDLEEAYGCGNTDAFNDLVEERATEDGAIGALDILEDIAYKVVGVSPGFGIVVEVTARVLKADE